MGTSFFISLESVSMSGSHSTLIPLCLSHGSNMARTISGTTYSRVTSTRKLRISGKGWVVDGRGSLLLIAMAA